MFRYITLLFASVFALSFTLADNNITIYLVGDSTMSVKEKRAYPETGWGMPFTAFFDESVKIDNRAKNGRSTKTFITEGLWQPVVDHLKAGDYVLIQFGHNDEVPTKAAYATETEFTANLTRFVNDVRSKNAVPVLITPAARRKFDAAGQIEDTHKVYAALIRTVAAMNKVALIDLSDKSMALLQQLGSEKTVFLFNHLQPGENPNYPDGRTDDTHFNELGARKMAELVLAQIRSSVPELAKHIVQPKAKPVK